MPRLQDELEEVRDEAQLMRTLRLFRRETLVRIAGRRLRGCVRPKKRCCS